MVKLALALLSTILVGGAAPLSRVVNTAEELKAAIESARGGEVIRLGTARFGAVDIDMKQLSPAILLVAADPSKKPTIASLTITRSSGVHLRDLEISSGRVATEHEWSLLIDIRDSSDIEIRDTYVHGSLDGNPTNDKTGFGARNTSNLVVRDSKFEELYKGLTMTGVTDGRFENNEIVGLQLDGINVVSSKRVTFRRNYVHDFRPVADDHPDGLQGWTTKTSDGLEDLLITENVFAFSPDHRAQGIFITDEGGFAGTPKAHKRIRIENNLIFAPMWHGILVDGVSGVTLTGNYVLDAPGGPPVQGGPLFPWIKVTNSSDVVLAGNEAPRFLMDHEDTFYVPAHNKAHGIRNSRSQFDKLLAQWRAGAPAPSDR